MCEPYNLETGNASLSTFTCKPINDTFRITDKTTMKISYPCGWDSCATKLWGVCIPAPKTCTDTITTSPSIDIEIKNFFYYAKIASSNEYKDVRLVEPFNSFETTSYSGSIKLIMGNTISTFDFTKGTLFKINSSNQSMRFLIGTINYFDESSQYESLEIIVETFLDFCINTNGNSAVTLSVETKVKSTYNGTTSTDKYSDKFGLYSYNSAYASSVPNVLSPQLVYSCVACSTDGKYLVAGSKQNDVSDDQSLLFWNFNISDNPQYIDLNPNDKERNFNTVAIGFENNVISVYGGAENSVYFKYTSVDSGKTWTQVGYNNDNNWVLTCCDTLGRNVYFAKNKDGEIRYSLDGMVNLKSTKIDIKNPIWLSSYMSSNGNNVIICDSYSVYLMLNKSAKFNKVDLTGKANGDIVDVAVNDNGDILVATKSYVYFRKNGGSFLTLSTANWPSISLYITSCCMSNDAKYIALCTSNGYLILYILTNGSYGFGNSCNMSQSGDTYLKIRGSNDLNTMYAISTNQRVIFRTTNRWGYQ